MSQRETDKRRISLELSEEMLLWLDELKSQMGFRSRGGLVEHLLSEVRGQDGSEEVEVLDPREVAGLGGDEGTPAPDRAGRLDDDVAIVLVSSGLVASRDQERV